MPNWRELERRPVNARFFERLDEPELADREPAAGPMSDAPEPDPYMDAGSHPDCVERVWDDIGQTLPEDCRFGVRRNAVLAHPVQASCSLCRTELSTHYGSQSQSAPTPLQQVWTDCYLEHGPYRGTDFKESYPATNIPARTASPSPSAVSKTSASPAIGSLVTANWIEAQHSRSRSIGSMRAAAPLAACSRIPPATRSRSTSPLPSSFAHAPWRSRRSAAVNAIGGDSPITEHKRC